MSQASVWVAQLEFEHVQQYLFEGTTLKTMIGANTLLGEFLRGRLTPSGFERDKGLPGLALRAGAKLPPGINLSLLPESCDRDPIKEQDDPRMSWQQGILTRDGGHFQGVFLDEGEANAFLAAARQAASRQLPGLVLKAKLLPLSKQVGSWQIEEEKKPVERGSSALPFDLPQQQGCQVSGQGPATTELLSADGRTMYVSASVKHKHDKAVELDSGTSFDIVGLLKREIVRRLQESAPQKYIRFPTEFEEVARLSGYLAVIAADGNNVGRRFNDWRGRPTPGLIDFDREVSGEQFFHSMRVCVRRALVEAIVRVFEPIAAKGATLPFRLLMLGGDDLLLVCDAAYAAHFVTAYANELRDSQLKNKQYLDVGIGVAIVKKKFPFHRSHALAEQLAASAKRLYRTLPEGCGSVVDWLSITEAWHEDVREVRDRDTVRRFPGETLLLSRKPYLILGDDSLETLLKAAKLANQGTTDGDQTRAARSQLIALAHGLPRGSLQADQALRLLPDDARHHLDPVLTRNGEGDRSLWHRHGANVSSTALMDFLELFELERLRVRSE